MPLDRERLAKLMAMTTSDKDPEALSALRMANKMLSAERTTWGDILRDVPRDIRLSIFANAEPDHTGWEDPAYLSDKVQIDLMFRCIYSAPRTGNEDFWRIMDAMHESYKQHGRLTAAQYKIIRHAYGRTIKSPV